MMELPPMTDTQARQFLFNMYKGKRLNEGLTDWRTHDKDVLTRQLTRDELQLIEEINKSTGN